MWREGELVHVLVEDEGAGFDPSAVGRGFGLFSVRERLRHLGGSLRIEAVPGDGTRAHVTVPLGNPRAVEGG